MIGAVDAMLKADEVQLTSYQKIGTGLCLTTIQGVADAGIAVELGM